MEGTRLGPYEILEPLGAGGMGEVWLARDTRLGRQVAVKVLPAEFASDPERLARFEQEARAAAALNHPHIAAIFDVGADGSTHYMVQERLTGATLRDTLEAGPLSLDRTLDLGAEITEALKAAHRAGIVHRDLKPENVFVTEDGHAKVLDFGLAKLTEVASGPMGSQSMSPTVLGTQAGAIMGTAGYMAPEQVQGEAVDARADVFALGCLLWEMATGRRAFAGKSVPHTLHKILDEEPEGHDTEAGGALPLRLRWLLERMLAKSPDERAQSAADVLGELHRVRHELDSGTAVVSGAGKTDRSGVGANEPPRARNALVVGAVAVAALLVGLLAGAWWTHTPVEPPPLVHFTFDLAGDDNSFTRAGRRVLSISPDGRRVAFSDEDAIQLRDLDDPELVPVRGTYDPSSPIFSPDGLWLAFWNTGELRKIPIGGGTAVRLAEISHPHGMHWSSDGGILAAVDDDADGAGLVVRVPDTGGTVEELVRVEGRSTQGPSLLPGGEWVLFGLVEPGQPWSDGSIVVQSLTTGEQRLLVAGGTEPRYVHSGHLTFARDTSLLAVPFDVDRVEVTGGPVPVLEGISLAPTGGAYYDLTPAGDLTFVLDGGNVSERSMVWYSAGGDMEALPFPRADIDNPALSPDGSRIAVGEYDGALERIAIYDLGRNTRQWLTAGGQQGLDPFWSPDGEWVYYTGADGIYRARADFSGIVEEVGEGLKETYLGGISADGRLAGVRYQDSATGSWDVGVIDLEVGTITAVGSSDSAEFDPRISPDGLLLAYTSFEGNQFRAFVRDIETGELRVVSPGSGGDATWGRGGEFLYFADEQGQVFRVTVARRPSLTVSAPEPVFRRSNMRDGTLSPDVADARFLALANLDLDSDAAARERTRIAVVLGWGRELVERVRPRD